MSNKKVGNFRSNLFGGFNRKDVVGYIKQLHDKLAELEEDNEFLREKLNSFEPSAEIHPSVQDAERLSDTSSENAHNIAAHDTSGSDAEPQEPSESLASDSEPDLSSPLSESGSAFDSKEDASQSESEQSNCNERTEQPDTVSAPKSTPVVSIRKPVSAAGNLKKVQIRRGKKR